MAGVGILTEIAPTSPTAPQAIIPLGEVAFGLPLGVNVLVTMLIIGRIWYISQGAPKILPSKAIQAAIVVVVESGALVVVVQVTFVILFVTGNHAQNIVVAIGEQVYVGVPFFNFDMFTDGGIVTATGHRANTHHSPGWNG